MVSFNWNQLQKPIICLAPMAGYTDSAYRQLIKTIAPGVICFTEFTSADGIVYESQNTLKQVEFNPEVERPIVAQIFGKHPENFTKAAMYLTASGVDAIDINMGCPARTVVSSDHGSALLEKPDHAAKLVEATVKGTNLPVSVKTRLGVCNCDADFIIKYCKLMENAGASLITLHGRTAKQMYTGKADFSLIYEVKKYVKIPVIGNGDITSVEIAKEKLGNLDGLMIGRGTMGNPWLMKEIFEAFHGDATYRGPTTFAEKLPWFIKHLELSVETKGERKGTLEMRKYLASAIKDFKNASDYRSKVVHIETLADGIRVLHEVQNAIQAEQVAPHEL